MKTPLRVLLFTVFVGTCWLFSNEALAQDEPSVDDSQPSANSPILAAPEYSLGFDRESRSSAPPPTYQFTSRLAQGAGLHPVQGYDFSHTVLFDFGFHYRLSDERNIALRGAIGYSLDGFWGDSTHAATFALGISGGGRLVSVGYQAAYIAGIRDHVVTVWDSSGSQVNIYQGSVGLQHGLMIGFGLFGIHVEHQMMWLVHDVAHAFRWYLSLDWGQLVYRVRRSSDRTVAIGTAPGEYSPL